jgi:subtilisin family serine protease
MSLNYGDVQSVREAVQVAVAKGIIVVTSAGASQRDACTTSPGGATGVITAAGSDVLDMKMSFSNYGPCVKLFAPGDNILSADIKDDNSTMVRSGSSMSAALVAGASALVLEVFPDASPCDVQQILIDGSLKNIVQLSNSEEDLSTPNRLLQVGYGFLGL